MSKKIKQPKLIKDIIIENGGVEAVILNILNNLKK